MSIPVSSGIGTGQAQVFDYERTGRTLDKFVDYAMQEKAYNKKVKAAKEAEETRKKSDKYNEQISDLQKIDYSKLKMADREVAASKVNEAVETFKGNFEDIYNGGKKSLEFQDKIAELRIWMANSMETAEFEKEKRKDIEQNPELYDEEQKEELLKGIKTPNLHLGNEGYGENIYQQPIVEDVAGFVAKNMRNIYYKPEVHNETDEKIVSLTGDIFVSDEESFAEFKKQVKINSQLQLQIRTLNKLKKQDELTDDMLKEVHDAGKARLPQSKKYINTTKDKKEDKEDKTKLDYNISTATINGGETPVFNSSKPIKVSGQIEYKSKSGTQERAVVNESTISDLRVDKDGKIYGTMVMPVVVGTKKVDGKTKDIIENREREVRLRSVAAINAANTQVIKITGGDNLLEALKKQSSYGTVPSEGGKKNEETSESGVNWK